MLQKSNLWSSPLLCNLLKLYCYTVSFVKTFAQHLHNLSDLNFDEKCNCLWSLCDVSFFFLFCLRVSVCAHTRIGMKGVSTASKAVSTYQTLVFWLPPWKKTPLSFLLSSRWVGWTRIHLRGIIMMMLKKKIREYILDKYLIELKNKHRAAIFAFLFGVLSVLIHRAIYYQRRWVKLDADYLRYFDTDKVTKQMHPKTQWCVQTQAQNGSAVFVYDSVQEILLTY